MPKWRWKSVGWACIGLSVLTVLSSAAEAFGEGSCPSGSAAPGGDNNRQLALLVGVGHYRSEVVPDLTAPALDVEQMRRLLTQGYGFPPENVCTLLNEQATLEGFRLTFEKALLQRARRNDVVVIYFAGHGSQAPDRNQDEADGLDETLLLFDSRTRGIPDLTDDEFHQLLGRLYEKTRNITVILDSCNSGTAARGENDLYLVRSVPPAGGTANLPLLDGGDGDSGQFFPRNMPELVLLSASQDGESAREIPHYGGIFTSSLQLALSQAGSRPLTYAQLERQVQNWVRAESPQIPYFQGNLERLVLGEVALKRPGRWEVIHPGPPLRLGGPPIPGLGEGAELRIYGGATDGEALRDPARAKATALIDSFSGLNATAQVDPSTQSGEAIQAGDLAVLVRPAYEFLRVRVRIRPSGEPGGVPLKLAAELRKAVQQVSEANLLVELTQRRGSFELSAPNRGGLQLLGPEGRVRQAFSGSVIGQAYAAANNLWQQARQKALLRLRGEGGADFVDGETLQVQLVPASRQRAAVQGKWSQSEPNREQEIPLGYRWNVKVGLGEGSPKPLLIGVLILSSDGSIAALPSGRRRVRLEPGLSYVFNLPDETFVGRPPLDVPDQVLVFGTQESNPVAWYLLAESALTRDAQSGVAGTDSGLFRALDRYLGLGTRGGPAQGGTREDTTWTMSWIPMRVVAEQDDVP